MNRSDISEIKQIEIECGLANWKVEDYLKEINRKDSITKTAVLNNTIVGFILARPITMGNVSQSNCAEIYNIATKEEWRKKGVGSFLLNDVIEICVNNKISEIFLEVRKSNKTARTFYLKKEFKEIGERKNYYAAPIEDAVIMKYILNTKSVKK